MTTEVRPTSAPPLPTEPPFSRALRVTAGGCLLAAAVLNGLSQAVGHALTGDLSFGERLRRAVDQPLWHAIEQNALVASSLFLPLGLLGVAHVCRFRAPVLTAVATPLFVWGMWGFANILSMGYVAGTVAPSALSIEAAVALEEGLVSSPGVFGLALVPHIVGSFLGLLLLSGAAWRSGVFPRPAVALFVTFLLWDFLLPDILGPVAPHVLLVVSWVWLGVHLVRLPQATWRGALPDRS